MATTNKNRVLILGIILLLVTNITTIIGIVWHLQNHEYKQEVQADTNNNNDIVNMPRGRFFKDKLDLNQEQTFIFRDLYHQYKRDASDISDKMKLIRKNMIDELTRENPDTISLNKISVSIGVLHTELKNLTIDYFIDMKNNCTTEQELKLTEIFNSLLNEQSDVRMPNNNGERQFGRKWKNKNHQLNK